MANQIVLVNVQQTLAPTPNKLQQTGAFVSQGGTSLTPGTYSLLTQASSLTSLLIGATTVSGIAQTAGLATVTLVSTTISSGTYNSTTGLVTLTLAAASGLKPGNLVTISSATGTGSFASINGTWSAGTATTGTTLTFTIATTLTMTITGGSVAGTTGLANGTQFWVTIAGATGSTVAYNGTFLATVASATTFTYAVPSGTASPATGTLTATLGNSGELQQMNTTFWAQGSQTSVYVLELGAGTPAQGVTALSAFITANTPQFFYSYLVPRIWAAESTFVTFAGTFTATNSRTYFFITATTGNYSSWSTPGTLKSALVMIEAPNIPSTEFSLASTFWDTLSYNPSSTNQVPPLAFTYEYGVTAYPPAGNGTLFATLRAANVNIIGTGAEGGISNTIIFWGHLMDGNPFNYWYSIDWLAINEQLSLANAVINGSNTSLNPLYYDQDGINRLQSVAAQTISNWLSYGLGLGSVVLTELPQSQFVANYEAGLYAGQAVLNAEPFINYVAENPSDYAIGKYAGLWVVCSPLRGFEQIIFNINATQFV